jgi:hypothetical protein
METPVAKADFYMALREVFSDFSDIVLALLLAFLMLSLVTTVSLMSWEKGPLKTFF